MWANNLRVFAVFAVIVLHIASGFVGNIEMSEPDYGGYNWWAGNIFDSITRWCVPLFVMISGYFLLCKDEGNFIFFKKRIKKILIPLIFWSLIFSFWILFIAYIRGDIEEGYKEIVRGVALGRPYFHLWYLFMIPLLYIITPILRLCLSTWSKNEILFFILFSFFLAAINALFNNFSSNLSLKPEGILFTNIFLSYIGYYLLDGYINQFQIKTNTKICITVLFVSLSITILGSYFFSYKYFYSYLSINTILASVSLFLLIRKHINIDLKLSHASKLSFGIYLVHPILLDIFLSLAKDSFLSTINIYGYIPLVSILIFISSYVTIIIMSKTKYLSKCI